MQRRPARRRRLATLLALCLYGVACTTPLPPLPEARPLGRGLDPASAAGFDRTPAGEFQEPEGTLTLPVVLSAALRNSPRLEAFDWQVRADEARALQAGLLPNPSLAIEGENFAGGGDFTGYDVAETTLFLGQLVELGGKRAARRRMALLERELSGWDYEAARLDVLTETTQLFVAALGARRRLELANEILRVSKESLAATRARVRAGAASSVEEARSEVAVATMEVERARRELELEAARSALASAWAGTPRFGELDGDLSALRALPSLEQVAAALAENPDLARWTSERIRRETEISLARAGAIPDVTAGLGVRHFNESDDAALVFAVEIPFPVFDRSQGRVAAAHAEARRADALARDARLRLSRELLGAHAAASAAHQSARTLEERVLPQAQAAFERTRQAYRKGLFRLVDVLDAQRTLFDAQTEYVNALERYHTTRAELERLAGSPLDDLETRSQ